MSTRPRVTAAGWGMPPTEWRPRRLAGIRRAVVHHDAIRRVEHTNCAHVAWAIDDYHRRVRGWAGFGYHRWVCPHGQLFEGRPLDAIGAHSEPANLDGIGYCLAGDDDEPATAEQLDTLADTIERDERRIGRVLAITTHRLVEPGSTRCPGDGMTAQLAEIRRLVDHRPPAPTVPVAPAFPGWQHFRAGARSSHVTTLGRWLERAGYGRHYRHGPGPRWSEADRRNVADFQRATPALARDADGYPGPLTWRLLYEAAQRAGKRR